MSSVYNISLLSHNINNSRYKNVNIINYLARKSNVTDNRKKSLRLDPRIECFKANEKILFVSRLGQIVMRGLIGKKNTVKYV